MAAIDILELCAREVARRSLVHGVTGTTPSLRMLVAIGLGACVVAFAASRPRETGRRRGAAALFAALLLVGVALQIEMGARLQSDGFYYYAYLRSLAFDRDVDFANDYRMLGLGDKANLFQPTATGHAHSAWTIGPAIMWAPFFAVAHVIAGGLGDPNVSADGISYPYKQAVCIANLLYGLLGCWFCYRLTARFFGPQTAAAATALVVGGSFLLWYLVKEPSMTHAPSMAAVAGFVWAWAATREQRTPWQWAALGVLAGIMSLIRWQNALFAVLPGWDCAALIAGSLLQKDRQTLRRALAGGVLFAVAAVIAFLPQCFAWRAIYGTWIAISPVGPQIRWTDPHLVDILWSARNGLLSTSPILYVGAIGLVGFSIARPAIGVPALVAVVLMTYFNACIQDWWGSAGFGGRRFDGTIPFFCVGLAAFGEYTIGVVRRRPAAVVVTLGALLVVWNLTLMRAAQEGAVRIGETVPFDRAWAAQAQAFHRWFGNPFTYPASLLFALRNGVSPGDYDVLSTNRFLSDPTQSSARVDVGGDDQWLIVEGWHAPEREGPITFRWAATPAVIRVPLDHAVALHVQVRLHAFAYPGAPPQTMTLTAGGRACVPLSPHPAAPEPGPRASESATSRAPVPASPRTPEPPSPGGALPIGADWQIVDCLLERDAWRSGVNFVTLQFAELHRPVDVAGTRDDRPLAAAVDYVKFSVP